MQKVYKASNLKETKKIATEFANSLNGGEVVLLQGELGAGKTTFVKMVLETLGYKGVVHSPTFNILQQYIVKKFRVYHFDMYRIVDENETENFGFKDYLNGEDINSLVFVEWPENVVNILKKGYYVVVKINKLDEEGREFSFSYEKL